MDDDEPKRAPDLALAQLSRQDISTLSVSDLGERIDALKAEITRCEEAIAARDDTRAAAEKLFRT